MSKRMKCAIQLQELRKRIDKGLAEAEQGASVDGDVFMQGLMDDLDQRATKHKNVFLKK